MENYLSNNNKQLILSASIEMLKDKFEIILPLNELNKILNNIYSHIYNTNNNDLTIYDLNKLTLTNLKIYIENIIKKQNSNNEINENNKKNETFETIQKIDTKIMDNDYINNKLKELENNRRILPSISTDLYKDDSAANILQNNINPVSINIPSQNYIKKNYKNFIINSNNRDWFLHSNRNNIRFNIQINIKEHDIFVELICFPKKIKELTPYVIMNISDSIKNINYIFICDKNNDKWDIWKPCTKNIENIILNNQTWTITFYDFNNKILDIGEDNINIISAKIFETNKILLEIGEFIDQFNVNDNILIRNSKGIIYNKVVTNVLDNGINLKYILINKNDFNDDINDINDINDLINGKILNMSLQYSCIIKYCSI